MSRIQHLEGDCREVLKTLPDQSVHCCVTSPPYFGLRDYGTAKWEGGDSSCDHEAAKIAIGNSPSLKSTLTTNNGKGPKPGDKFSAGSQFGFSQSCPCGATRIDGQIGLEPTPDAYVAELVAVFREVRRVLRDDGTLWLNLGDSYAGSWGNYGGQNRSAGKQRAIVSGSRVPNEAWDERTKFLPPAARGFPGIKPKDLIGIPWRVAFALQADGWYLRQDIIWSKPNPMPESVRDRCTKAHEYLFLLSKNQRYFYDADAIAEPADAAGEFRKFNTSKKASRVVNGGLGSGNEHPDAVPVLVAEIRNRRSVWTVATQPFKEAHFATFPPDLIEPCIKAGCPKDGTVLDPFAGAGTTGLVADRLQRNAILIELNPAYSEMAHDRIKSDAPLFAESVA